MKRMSRLTVGVIVVLTITLAITATVVAFLDQRAFSFIDPEPDFRKAPMATSDDNLYIVWFNDNTPSNDGEVFFRASNDSGATFGDKLNLSNSTGIDSINSEIITSGDNVLVTWWEKANATSNVPVLRVSTDDGATFGPLLMLGTNGTIGQAEVEEEEE